MQAGYFLPIPGLEHKLDVVGRGSSLSVLHGGPTGAWEYAGGLSRYIEKNRAKIPTDVTEVQAAPVSGCLYSLANVNDSPLIWRVQLQVAF